MSVGPVRTAPRSIDDVLAESRRGLNRVDPITAERMQADGAVLVDIRPEPWRVANGVIPGALVLERNVLEWRLDPSCESRLDWVDDELYERDIVVFCNEGYASSLAAADLQRLGLRGATDIDGGFAAWVSAGLPIAAPEE